MTDTEKTGSNEKTVVRGLCFIGGSGHTNSVQVEQG